MKEDRLTSLKSNLKIHRFMLAARIYFEHYLLMSFGLSFEPRIYTLNIPKVRDISTSLRRIFLMLPRVTVCLTDCMSLSLSVLGSDLAPTMDVSYSNLIQPMFTFHKSCAE